MRFLCGVCAPGRVVRISLNCTENRCEFVIATTILYRVFENLQTTNLYTHLSRSSAVRHEKYLVLPAGNVTWKQFSRPRTDGCSGLISTPPLLRSNDCMMLCDWPDRSDSCERDVLRRGPLPGLAFLR